MQIRIIPQNNRSVTMVGAGQLKPAAAKKASGNAFGGAQCMVTISKEGRKLSEQSKAQTAKSARSLKVEKNMLRQIEQSEALDKQSNALKDEYAELVNTDEYIELLKKIKKAAKSTNNSYMSKEDRETIEKKTQLLREISDQKQKQIEENQKQAAYAQDMAAQLSKRQDEIDENNRDLLILLKSIEESEEAEEERESGEVGESGNNDVTAQGSVSEAIQNSATRFTASSMQRELGVLGAIDGLNADGHGYVDRATEILRNAYSEADDIRMILADEHYTFAEKKEAVFHFGAKLIGAYNNPVTNEPKADAFKELEILVDENATEEEKEEALAAYRAKMETFGDLGIYRNRGVQMIKDSHEGKLLHIANNPLQGLEETKGIMLQSAVDAAFNAASQGKLEEASQELEDAVKEIIDERNDITDIDDKKEDDEEEQEIGELLQIKAEEEEKEQIQE